MRTLSRSIRQTLCGLSRLGSLFSLSSFRKKVYLFPLSFSKSFSMTSQPHSPDSVVVRRPIQTPHKVYGQVTHHIKHDQARPLMYHGRARFPGKKQTPTQRTQSGETICWSFDFFCSYTSCRASPGIAPASEITTSAGIGRIRTLRDQSNPPPDS